jgi:hypothetical protein
VIARHTVWVLAGCSYWGAYRGLCTMYLFMRVYIHMRVDTEGYSSGFLGVKYHDGCFKCILKGLGIVSRDYRPLFFPHQTSCLELEFHNQDCFSI